MQKLDTYVVAFEVYCGKNSARIVRDADVLDPECTVTTKTVMGLLQKGNLLGKGHHVYMDNYYSSPEHFGSYILKRHMHAVHVEATGRICQKVLQRQS